MLAAREPLENIFLNGQWLLKHIVVPVSRDLKSFHDQMTVSRGIAGRGCMLAAVDFNDQALFEADEIKNVILKRRLSAKLESCQPSIAQQPPHLRFSIRG